MRQSSSSSVLFIVYFRARATKLTDLELLFLFSLEQSIQYRLEGGTTSGHPDDAKSENPGPAENFASENTDDRSSVSAGL